MGDSRRIRARPTANDVEALLFRGHIVKMRIGRLGNAPALCLSVFTPNRTHLELYVHSPPDWLSIGAPVEGRYYEAALDDKNAFIVEEIRLDRNMRPASLRSLIIERIERTVDGSILLEGRREEGGLFSYIMEDEGLTRGLGETPRNVYGVFIERNGIPILAAVLPVQEIEMMEKTRRLISELAKEAEQSPELDYLQSSS